MRRIVCTLRCCLVASWLDRLSRYSNEEPEDPENETMNSENRLSHATVACYR